MTSFSFGVYSILLLSLCNRHTMIANTRNKLKFWSKIRGIIFLVLWSVISSDSNVTEVYVGAEETATYTTNVTPSSTRWVGGVLQYRDNLKRETREMRLEKCVNLCVFSVTTAVLFNLLYVIWLLEQLVSCIYCCSNCLRKNRFSKLKCCELYSFIFFKRCLID